MRLLLGPCCPTFPVLPAKARDNAQAHARTTTTRVTTISTLIIPLPVTSYSHTGTHTPLSSILSSSRPLHNRCHAFTFVYYQSPDTHNHAVIPARSHFTSTFHLTSPCHTGSHSVAMTILGPYPHHSPCHASSIILRRRHTFRHLTSL